MARKNRVALRQQARQVYIVKSGGPTNKTRAARVIGLHDDVFDSFATLSEASFGKTLHLEDLTDLAAASQVQDGEATVVLGQTAFLKHAFVKGEYTGDDRTSATYQLMEDSAGTVTARGSDTADFTALARWQLVSGTAQDLLDSYPTYDPTKVIKRRDRRSYVLPADGVKRLYEAKQDQLTPPTTAPTGTGDDAFWYAYSPVVQAFDPGPLQKQLDNHERRITTLEEDGPGGATVVNEPGDSETSAISQQAATRLSEMVQARIPAPLWVQGADYVAGDIVTYEAKRWRYLQAQDDSQEPPHEIPGEIELVDDTSELAERLTQAESGLDSVRLANYFQDQELVQHDTRIRSLSTGAQRIQNGNVLGFTRLFDAYFAAPDLDQIFIPNTIVDSFFASINKRVYVRGRVVNAGGGALVVSAGTVYWDGIIEGTSGGDNDAVRILSGGRAYTRGIINGAGRFGIVNQGGYIEHVGDVYAGFLASVIHNAGTTIIRGKVYSTPGFNRSNVVEFRGGTMVLDGGTVDSTLGGRPGTTAVFVDAPGLVLRNQTIIAEAGGYALKSDGVAVTVRVQGKFNYRGLIDPAITLEYDTEYSAFPVGEAGGLPPADSVTEAMLAPAVRTKLNAAGGGGSVSSDVFFKVSGGYQGNSVDTSMSLADSSQGAGFQTIPFSVVEADVKPAGANGGWDANTRFYTIGVAGLYQMKINLRPRDASTGTPPGKRYGIGVNTTNSDGPDFLWSQTLNSSNGLQNTVDKYLNAGDQVRGFCYLDGFSAGCGGMFSIRLIGAAK